MSVSGCITNISRASLHDGPGVRSVVYFKGCTLKCKWCHNPENLSFSEIILYMPSKCIHCGRCVSLCPECHEIIGNGMVYHREKCITCGKCAESCPSCALTLCGKKMTVDEVLKEVMKDKHCYTESGGGITLSGGECLLQDEFCKELLQRCKKEGISTAVESALYVPTSNMESVSPYVDTFFADIKLPDEKRHKEYTGQSNKLILENLSRLTRIHESVILRIPLIPNVNDSISDMEAFGKIISSFGEGVKGIELLKYNYLAESKYKIAGMTYNSFGNETQDDETVIKLAKTLEEAINRCFPVYFHK